MKYLSENEQICPPFVQRTFSAESGRVGRSAYRDIVSNISEILAVSNSVDALPYSRDNDLTHLFTN